MTPESRRGASPRRVLPCIEGEPLFSAAASRQIEVLALEQAPCGTLIPRAGIALARLSMAQVPHARKAWIVAGGGGNGGDGLHAAAELRAAGVEVMISMPSGADRATPSCRQALERAIGAGAVLRPLRHDEGVDLVVDALLGLGTRPALSSEHARAIDAMNRCPAPRLAVDLPSGLHPDTGALIGASAVRASMTLCLLTLKRGLFTGLGREHAGAVWLDDLGWRPAVGTPGRAGLRLTAQSDWTLAAGSRNHAQHKGSFRDVIVIGGAPGMTGAARLAAHAALCAGAGRVIVSLLDPLAAASDPTRPEWLWRPAADLLCGRSLAASTVVCGCGGGSVIREHLPAVLSQALGLVLDADALNAVAADRMLREMLMRRGPRGQATVITPHPLEAARLLESTSASVQSDRFAAAGELAVQLGCVVVLKGSGTIIAAPGSPPLVNSTGNAALATAGTGDVLAGWIGGHWSQPGLGSKATGTEEAKASAAAAVWLHGRAADQRPGRALPALDLVGAMARAAQALQAGQPGA